MLNEKCAHGNHLLSDGSPEINLEIAVAQRGERRMQPHQTRRMAARLDKRDINRAHAVEIKITKNNTSRVKGNDKIAEDHMR